MNFSGNGMVFRLSVPNDRPYTWCLNGRQRVDRSAGEQQDRGKQQTAYSLQVLFHILSSSFCTVTESGPGNIAGATLYFGFIPNRTAFEAMRPTEPDSRTLWDSFVSFPCLRPEKFPCCRESETLPVPLCSFDLRL